MNPRERRGEEIHQLWQNLQQQQPHSFNYVNYSVGWSEDTTTTRASSAEGTKTSCHDCGNQAKKECGHQRCRTCCKSRGFDCSTHVKSTWVPTSLRRERERERHRLSSPSAFGVKKRRLFTNEITTSHHTSTSNNTTRSFDTCFTHQQDATSFQEGLPGQFSGQAVFKCVHVTAINDGEDDYAYQTAVKIGGHVFKGLLYDQGVDVKDKFPNISELHLEGISGSSGIDGRIRVYSNSSPITEPSSLYVASGAYGNPPGDSGR